PGTLVPRVRHMRSGKFDVKYEPDLLMVIAGSKNNTYQLADLQGRLLKRRVNGDSLHVYRYHFHKNNSVRYE
ncbi:hypothetical protein BJV82DRAFT_525043, partial [Fennellomyces sp. T-0311]